MEASLVVPGPLDVVGTPSRFHLWDEDPVNHPRPTLMPTGSVCAQQVNLSFAFVGLARQLGSGSRLLGRAAQR
jgi:hypothetical protein